MSAAAIDPLSLTDDDIIRIDYRRWWQTCGTIESRDGQLIGAAKGDALQPTAVQRQIDDAITWCEENEQPCRVIILKDRKAGATTWLTGKSYHLLRSSQAHLLQIGDQYQTTQTMLDMLRRYDGKDGFDAWPNKRTRLTQDAKNGIGEWSNGSTLWTDTAGDRRPGMGKTPTVIHVEEAAHWGNAEKAMLALLNSIADLPGTYIFIASTANGVGNFYHETFGGAVTLAERKRGQIGNGWIKVFSPWYASTWSQRHVTPEDAAEILRTMSARERRGKALYGWTTGQIAFRRFTIANKCNGNESSFDQEYPEDPVGAFLTSGSPRFDTDGVTRLLEQAKANRDSFASIEKQPDGRLTWLDSPQGWVWWREMPVVGGRYVGFADPMTGRQSEGAKRRDTHACGILRDAWTDGKGQHPAEVVALIYGVGPHGEPGECRWDIDILVDKFYRLVRWYGDPMVIIEANNSGAEFIGYAEQAGMTMWKREKPMDSRPGKKLDIFGFQTTSTTRRQWVGACAQYVREQQLDVRFGPWASQFSTFVTDDHGDGKAMEGQYDDAITGIGMGLLLCQSGNANLYRLPVGAPLQSFAPAGMGFGLTGQPAERFNALS